MAELKNYVLVYYKKRNGAIEKTLEGIGPAMLKLWALQNTTSSKASLIFEKESGKVIFLATGKKDSMPDVQKEDLGYIEDYGLAIIDDELTAI